MGLGYRGTERRTSARSHITRAIRTIAGLSMPAVLTLAGCGGSDGDGGDTPTATGENTAPAADAVGTDGGQAQAPTPPLPCTQQRHMVTFDFAGTMTVQDELDVVTQWLAGDEPDPRPGAAEISQAYRERGYELLYLTASPPDLTVEGLPVPAAVEDWLTRHGFATGEGVRVHGYTGGGDNREAILSITEELLRLTAEDVRLDAGYTDDEDRVYPLASGGIPAERIYTLGPNAGAAGTTALANDDLVAHLPAVQDLPAVCTPG